jgi:hypothetical protein
MSAYGPQRRFAAMQHDACTGRRSGLSSDAAGTATPDPKADMWDTASRLQFSWSAPHVRGEATNAVRGASVSVGSVTNRRNQLRHSPLTTMRRTTPMIGRFAMPYRHCNVLRLKIDADQGSNEYHWYQ